MDRSSGFLVERTEFTTASLRTGGKQSSAIAGKRTGGWWFFLTDQTNRISLRKIRRDYVNAMAVDEEDDEPDDDDDDADEN